MILQQQNLMTSRAQTTSEFAIILSILLIGIAIFASGVIDFPSFGVNTQNTILSSYWNSQDISIIDVYDNGTDITLTLKNDIQYQIEIQTVQIDDISKQFSLELQPGASGTVVMNSVVANNYVSITYQNKENSQVYFLEGPGVSFLE